ncbi:hypothetical protein CTAYLR_009316 [Chrysophaeum taylorii]|uniref:RING-type domain-containing protein n=1 Tax=Chrysophaeum taylorii TaxID=2483200 RepID=A0AAD7XNL9_9STRA|nr:hypothetical protein CTAYLR_009316 [Chrysophaeum taylorii]
MIASSSSVGVCCGLCGLVTSTEKDEEGEFDAELSSRVWSEMEEHVRREHCAACVSCGAVAGGLVEVATGEIASWIRRSRTRSPLHALRAHRREQARTAERARRAAASEAPRPWPEDLFYRYGLVAEGSRRADESPAPPMMQQRRRRRCGHAVCVGCAVATAQAARGGKASCPAAGCEAYVDARALAVFLPRENADASFTCVACGDPRPERDRVSLHDPDPERYAFQRQRRDLLDLYPANFEVSRALPLSLLRAEDPPRLVALAEGAKRPASPLSDEDDHHIVGGEFGTGRHKRRRHQTPDAVPEACELCAPCAERWLSIQARDGVAYVRCPTPRCRAPLSRETLELLLTPEAYQAHLKRARRSFESRLRQLQTSARSTSFRAAETATDDAKQALSKTTTTSAADDDGTLAFLRWAGDATRACPECHVIIYRSEGCAHMSCSCGAEFNWDRAERIVDPPDAPAPPKPPALPRDLPDSPADLRQALLVERARSTALQNELDRMRRRVVSARAHPPPQRPPPQRPPPRRLDYALAPTQPDDAASAAAAPPP